MRGKIPSSYKPTDYLTSFLKRGYKPSREGIDLTKKMRSVATLSLKGKFFLVGRAGIHLSDDVNLSNFFSDEG
jgi:hypothetical protein